MLGTRTRNKFLRTRTRLGLGPSRTRPCLMGNHHQVVKSWLNDSVMTPIIVAGTGIEGSNSNQLSYPRGIFVDVNLDLYVTDCNNNRVQLFRLGNSNGITVVGRLSPNPTISLSCPTDIVLDDEKYLFIVDSFNDRIVGSGVNGFRCLVGCYGGAHLFNQPKFCSTPVWNRNGITFANQMALGSKPLTIFINEKNSVYTINKEKTQILIWHEGNIDPAMIILSDFYNPSSLFVTSNGDIYIDNGEKNGRVEKWISNTSTWVTVLFAYSSCKGLFIDTMDNLYCSMSNHHHVVKRYLYDRITTLAGVAGTGDKGSDDDQLNHPHGIFVDEKFDLYVADCGNNRVQCFRSGKSDGITVAGDKSFSSTISLNCPTGITFDAEKYLFIVDSNNHRILRLGPSGFRCVVGCREGVFQSTQLSSPFSLSFGHFGNMFVTDAGNNRIQKFQYLKNSCDMSSVVQWTNSSALTTNSQIYSRDCGQDKFYYDSFEVKVPESRYYTIWSSSNIDTFGYIYENSFDPLNPSANSSRKDNDGEFNGQFKFEIPLYVNTTYILVVTTFHPITLGEINITIWGLKDVTVKRLTPHKTLGSCFVLEYLGLILDTIRFQIIVPDEKKLRIIESIESVLHKRIINKRQLFSLLGHLQFAMRAILPGRWFLSFLITLSTSVKQLFHNVTVGQECKNDLMMWFKFPQLWNGVSFFMQPSLTLVSDLDLYTDAVTSLGFGIVYGNKWRYDSCSNAPLQEYFVNPKPSIAYLELYSAVVASLLWGKEWSSKRTLFHSDNTATVQIINKGRSRCPAIMKVMRHLTLQAAKCNFYVRARYVPGKHNVLADPFSCLKIQKFKALLPTADEFPVPVPHASQVIYL
ncbi:unnamed protein product [Didymodactylos carnosus]|uniref:Uncharacterized protein n=1 Tax=Didymodactylos carnosus TaxID=1234261 RepID=A0A815C0B4_9BILA|nr:unnamed protein product [Didymodactylos carnosus]CAF4069452.1 unnamed protein product [Didymodactylos carnosus]